MKTDLNAAWKRLEQIIKVTGHTVNSFAKHIGLPRAENLYQIKRGNNGISRDLARRIHEKYPTCSMAWLMFGSDESAPPAAPSVSLTTALLESPVIRIPVYCKPQTGPLSTKEKPDNYLIISASAANGAELAVPYADDILSPFLRDSLVLLRAHQEAVLFGNMYLIEMENWRLFRIVEADENTDNLKLVTLAPERFGELSVSRDKIRSLRLVCGAVSNLIR